MKQVKAIATGIALATLFFGGRAREEGGQSGVRKLDADKDGFLSPAEFASH